LIKLSDVINNMGADVRHLLPVEVFQLLTELDRENLQSKQGELVVDVVGE
jgi:hypothetical protein